MKNPNLLASSDSDRHSKVVPDQYWHAVIGNGFRLFNQKQFDVILLRFFDLLRSLLIELVLSINRNFRYRETRFEAGKFYTPPRRGDFTCTVHKWLICSAAWLNFCVFLRVISRYYQASSGFGHSTLLERKFKR